MPEKFKIRTREELARLNVAKLPTSSKATVKKELLRSIEEMGFAKRDLEVVPRNVRKLTVNDLQDFAKKMAGVPQRNPVVDKLTIEDIQGIEYLFGSTKQAALGRLSVSPGKTLGAKARVDISCCCCTPCCCCAAADVDPFVDETGLASNLAF
jgi:hypothetical protein